MCIRDRLGTTLEDPYFKEGSKNYSELKINGIALLPLNTTFSDKKLTRQINQTLQEIFDL